MLQVSLTMGCPMDLQLFPLDSQTCHITVASYGWTADDVIYSWTVRARRHQVGELVPQMDPSRFHNRLYNHGEGPY